MDVNNLFKVILLLARPAAGKSEIIQYLQNLTMEDRINRFHLGRIQVIDDFPMIWTWFEEDDLLTQMGRPRIYTDENGYFLHNYLWDLLIERMNIEYAKLERDILEEKNTVDIKALLNIFLKKSLIMHPFYILMFPGQSLFVKTEKGLTPKNQIVFLSILYQMKN